MEKLIDQRRWIAQGETPSKRYVVELFEGSRGESDMALTLFDLLCDSTYSDTEDRESQIFELAKKLKDVASHDLGSMGIRAQVYSGVGLFFDNGTWQHADEAEEAAAVKFTNKEPVILDFWDEWTTMASLINCGYLKLYVKDESLTAAERKRLAKTLTIFENMNGVASAEAPAGYLQVTPEQFSNEPTWKPNYIPLAQRN
ncbi:hypothetical protein [Cohnella soli]|uniref:Uncharacterized protein n=1 Tax=Cohnella soli TaxID=425005 RepID=A0ABW0HKM5_9BACL